MENRDYYTFGEILNVLSEEFINVQELLENMNKQILVISESTTNHSLSLEWDNRNSKIFLNVAKDTQFYPRTMEVLADKWQKIEKIRNNRERAKFRLFDYNENDLVFEHDGTECNEDSFKPTIVIKNYEEFSDNYAQLLDERLFWVPEVYVKINSTQDLYISADGIYLGTKTADGAYCDIVFDASHGNLSLRTNRLAIPSIVASLFDTQIKIDDLPYEYKFIMDHTWHKTDYSIKDEYSSKGKESVFCGTNIKLVLKKQNNPNSN